MTPRPHPAAACSYQAAARLRDGVWECPNLPFPVNDLSADLRLEDGLLSIKHAQGSNGQTGLRVEGTIGLCDPANAPLDLQVALTDLELDQRLRDHTPAEYDELWDVFKPSGRVDAKVHLVRAQAGEPLANERDGRLPRRRGGLSPFPVSARPPDRPADPGKETF